MFLKYTEYYTHEMNCISFHIKAELHTEIKIDVSLLLRAYYIW